MISIPHTLVRPISTVTPDIATRQISGLAEVTGSGTGTKTGATGYILPTGIAGTGMFGFPGVQIYSESGGSLIATAYFYDSSGNAQGSSTVKSISSAGSYTVTSGTQGMSTSNSGATSNTSAWYSFGVSGDAAKTYYLAWTASMTNTAGGPAVEYTIDSIEISSGDTVNTIRSHLDEEIYSGLNKLDDYYVDTYKRFYGPVTVPIGGTIQARFTATNIRPVAGSWTATCSLTLITVS